MRVQIPPLQFQVLGSNPRWTNKNIQGGSSSEAQSEKTANKVGSTPTALKKLCKSGFKLDLLNVSLMEFSTSN